MVLVCWCFSSLAQTVTDSIQYLDEVVLSDTKLRAYTSGVKVRVLNDSVLANNAQSLTGLLAFNSNLYFKENGYGMVSSPSFRGTNASQTAVIWNGININSQLTGQTDFNTINVNNFSDVTVRSGGGSVQYGSGAIGGSIHLNNKLLFENHFENKFQVSFGSFNTKQTSFNSSYGSNEISINAGVSYINSDNDYKYLGTNKVNENGQYNNVNFNFNLGYFVSNKDVLKMYHQTFIGDRHFSGTVSTPSKSGYEDENYRTMLEWSRIANKYTSKLKVASLQEQFRYFENKEKSNYSFGKVNTYLVNYNLNLKVSNKLQFKTVLDYNKYKGSGSSFGSPEREAFSATLLMNHKATNKIVYNLNVRKDFTSGFTSPFVFAVDAGYTVNKFYEVKLNASKNYRVPTFNDLYWNPGGNLNLVPESSYQVDLGHQFTHKHFNVKLNSYYINTSDLIQWQPNTSGIWSPKNVAKVNSYGAELEFETRFHFKAHHFNITSHYSYTVSENIETKKQLIYVPFYKANLAVAYSCKKFSVYYQYLYNGNVFTTTDNLRGRFYSLEAYAVSNIGFNYSVLKTKKQQLKAGVLIKNIYNKNYQNVAFRPMPNRNFNIQLYYQF